MAEEKEKNPSLTGYTDSSPILPKMDQDFTVDCDQKIPQAKKLADRGKLNEALEMLVVLEKQTRTHGDAISTGRVLIAIVQICFKVKRFDLLNDQIQNLVKRRFQIKQSIAKMIQECMKFIEGISAKEDKLRLINTLREVSMGKIYVEVERARLTRMLAEIREQEGNINLAAELMEELHIESYGSMDKKEKVEFLLEQMRLHLANQDLMKTQIISKKINPKFFIDNNEQALKFKYYGLMIQLEQDTSFLNTSRHYQAVVNTDMVMMTPNRRQRMMTCAVLYCILSPFDSEQYDMMLNLNENKILEEIPIYRDILKVFLSKELINWQEICSRYKKDLLNFSIFDATKKHGIRCWKELRSRVLEHNIRIIASYYSRIYLRRLANLLSLIESETEDILSQLIVAKTISARLDRPTGVINFSESSRPETVLNKWSDEIDKLMALIQDTNYQIAKENMQLYPKD